MSTELPVRYVTVSGGTAFGVGVPIELWREIESEREIAYLLKSDAMRRRLLEAKARTGGISQVMARARLGTGRRGRNPERLS